jgi:hypothetical protein
VADHVRQHGDAIFYMAAATASPVTRTTVA